MAGTIPIAGFPHVQHGIQGDVVQQLPALQGLGTLEGFVRLVPPEPLSQQFLDAAGGRRFPGDSADQARTRLKELGQ
jgi:hypothetical protein